ncbi:hypothetical protein BURPS305_6635 [Burkholderia pseudomallei 305]|nr:hypothetical protein BURPS305_6635 [Burkholderia pseudomallei 305]
MNLLSISIYNSRPGCNEIGSTNPDRGRRNRISTSSTEFASSSITILRAPLESIRQYQFLNIINIR